MADERKEPTLSSAPLNVSEKNASEKKTGQSPKPAAPSNDTQRRQQTRQNRPSNTRPQPRQRPVEVKKTGGGLSVTALVVSLIAIAVAAFSTTQLLSANAIIEQQQSRIAGLENKLTLAGDTSSQSITSLSANLVTMSNDVKLSLSEIDKLWATRNVNKKAIAANAGKLADMQSGLDETNGIIDERVKATEKKLANLGNATQQQIKRIETSSKGLTEENSLKISSFNEKLDLQQQQFDDMGSGLSDLQQKVQTVSSLVNDLENQQQEQELLMASVRERLQQQNGDQAASGAQTTEQLSAAVKRLDELSRQVQSNRETTASLEAFRRTVNRDLLLLKQGVGQ